MYRIRKNATEPPIAFFIIKSLFYILLFAEHDAKRVFDSEDGARIRKRSVGVNRKHRKVVRFLIAANKVSAVRRKVEVAREIPSAIDLLFHRKVCAVAIERDKRIFAAIRDIQRFAVI